MLWVEIVVCGGGRVCGYWVACVRAYVDGRNSGEGMHMNVCLYIYM